MPTVKNTVTLAAAGDRFSIMQGSQYEVPNFPYLLELAIVAAAGDAPTLVLTTGSDVLAMNAVIDEKAATLPITREDIQFRDTGLAFEKIVAEVTATAAADVIRWVVSITPL